MSSSSKGKGSVKTKFWNKHLNKWQKKVQEKVVREDAKKQIKKERGSWQPNRNNHHIHYEKYNNYTYI